MRDVASRLAAAAAVIASSILVPAAAQAKGGAVRSCAPSDRTFALALHSKGVSCSQARGIERHAGQHHWALPFRLYGRTWRGAIYSHAHYSRALILVVNGASLRATIGIRCRGRGCPFATRRLVVPSARSCTSRAKGRCRRLAAIDLAGLLRHARLAIGAQLVVRILKPGWIGKQYVFNVRSGRAPAVVIRTIAAPPLPG